MTADHQPTTDVPSNILPFPAKRKRGFCLYVKREDLPSNAESISAHPRYSPAVYQREPLPLAYTPGGALLPPLDPRGIGGYRRIRLDRWRATKAWRALSAELDAATDALQSAVEAESDVDGALDEWDAVALRVCCYPTKRPWDLRAKLALVAAIAGVPFEWGMSRGQCETRAQHALALVDLVLRHACSA